MQWHFCEHLEKNGDETKYFPIKVGLHHGSSLILYIFDLVVHALTESTKEEVPTCMLFVDDLVPLVESREEINAKLKIWRNTLNQRVFV